MKKSDAYYEFDQILADLTSTSIGRRTFLASIPLLMAACASGEKSRYREGDNTGQDTGLTVNDERRMTQEALKEMRKDYPPLQDAEMQAYISHLGRRLVAANNLSGNPYSYNFTVVHVPAVNAFALPAGTVFVTTPLIAMADSEAELAGVVGHEIGHVKARHAAERMERAKKEEGRSWLYGIGGGLLGGAAGFGLGQLLCPPRDRACMAKATAAGAAAGAGGGLLIQKYKFMANSREDEMEADRIGFRTAVNAGYSKEHVGRFYAKLLKMEESRKQGGNPIMASLADAMSTHPPSRERVVQMNEMVAASPGQGSQVVSTATFDRMRKRAIEISPKARG